MKPTVVASLLVLHLAGCGAILEARHRVNRRRHATQARISENSPARAFQGHGQPVYSPEECVGPIVNGVCHGSILPRNAVPQRCYGQMLNGQCTGPMF